MNKYGSDKPDLRFGMEMVEVSDIFDGSGFRAFNGLNVEGKCLKAIGCERDGW